MTHRTIASKKVPGSGYWVLGITTALALILVLPACNVKTEKSADGKDKKVEISTPFGGLKVNNDADARDTGLPVFPNSRPKPQEHDNDSSANVNMSFGKFGLKVVVASYLTDAPPDKVLDFYRGEIGKYGKVLECKGGSIGGFKMDRKDSDKELHCDKEGDSTVVELKVGSQTLQHVVAVKPDGKGSEYSLVYVRAEGTDKDEPI
jgi:hypothetical protein